MAPGVKGCPGGGARWCRCENLAGVFACKTAQVDRAALHCRRHQFFKFRKPVLDVDKARDLGAGGFEENKPAVWRDIVVAVPG